MKKIAVIPILLAILAITGTEAMQMNKRYRGNQPTEQLCDAAAACDLKALRTHLAAGGNPAVNSLLRRQTALHLILEQSADATEGLRILLGATRNPDPVDRDGQTPLHYAAARSSLEATHLLLQAGANPNTYSQRWGHTPLELVSRRERRLGLSFTTYGDSGEDGYIAQRLIAAGANPNVAFDEYPLAHAVFFRKRAVTRALLDGGASIEIKHSDGTPLLHLAVRQLDEATTRLLLERGADIATIDQHHKTALQSSPAVQSSGLFSDSKNSFLVTRTLLELGAPMQEYRPFRCSCSSR